MSLDSPDDLKNFTEREKDTISAMINIRRTKSIAIFLQISPRIVEVHLQNIMMKVGFHSQEMIITKIRQSDDIHSYIIRYQNLLGIYLLKLIKNDKDLEFYAKKKNTIFLDPNIVNDKFGALFLQFMQFFLLLLQMKIMLTSL